MMSTCTLLAASITKRLPYLFFVVLMAGCAQEDSKHLSEISMQQGVEYRVSDGCRVVLVSSSPRISVRKSLETKQRYVMLLEGRANLNGCF